MGIVYYEVIVSILHSPQPGKSVSCCYSAPFILFRMLLSIAQWIPVLVVELSVLNHHTGTEVFVDIAVPSRQLPCDFPLLAFTKQLRL